MFNKRKKCRYLWKPKGLHLLQAAHVQGEALLEVPEAQPAVEPGEAEHEVHGDPHLGDVDLGVGDDGDVDHDWEGLVGHQRGRG